MARKHSKDRGGGPTRAIEALTAAGVAFTIHEYEHDPAARRYTLTLRQRTPPTPRQPDKKPLPIPVAIQAAFKAWAPKTAGEKAVLDELPAAKAARVVRRVLNAGIKAEGYTFVPASELK